MAFAHLLIALALVARDPESLSATGLLEHAETAFRDGCHHRDAPTQARQSFRLAATLYEALRQRGAHNPALYRNLGNAYLLAGDLPQAILAYRCGLRLAPTQRDLQASLAFARAQVAYPTPGGFARPPEEIGLLALCRLWPGGRLALTVFSYSMAWLAFTRWWMTGRSWLLHGGGVALAGAVLLAASLAAMEWDRRVEVRQPLVVLAEDGVLLRKGNGLTYPPRYETPLNRGVEARLRFARGDWLQIELSGGEVGWVPRACVFLDVS